MAAGMAGKITVGSLAPKVGKFLRSTKRVLASTERASRAERIAILGTGATVAYSTGKESGKNIEKAKHPSPRKDYRV